MEGKDRTGFCFNATDQFATFDVWKQHVESYEDNRSLSPLEKKIVASEATFRSPSCGSLPWPWTLLRFLV